MSGAPVVERPVMTNLGPAPPEAVKLRLRDGRRRDLRLAAPVHISLLSDLLHGGRPGFVEIVGASRLANGRLDGFDRTRPENFVDASDRGAVMARVRALREGERREVFFTPATLAMAKAGNDSVEESAVAWVDIDEPQRVARLRAFRHRPHAVVASGSGGVHAYWRLVAPLDGDLCEEVNRKLAGVLGADPQCCNRGRIMRVPATVNWKSAEAGGSGAWSRLVMCDLARPPYPAEILVRGLRDPKLAPRRRAQRTRRFDDRLAEPWRELEPADYYRVIVGLEPPKDGMINCPNAAHQDHHPSAKLYTGQGSGWFCFACGAGGSAVDMVAALRGLPTGRELAGSEFGECVEELRRLFGVEGRAASRMGGT